jgi:replicative DNA helicase
MAEAARKLAAADTPLYREAPNNIEAEQALLGAMLVNNDAFYRVSDFLKATTSTNPCTARSSRSHPNSSGWARWPTR